MDEIRELVLFHIEECVVKEEYDGEPTIDKEKLLEMFNEFKKFTKDNPRYKYQLCQRTAEMVKEPLEVPLTFEGFKEHVI